VTVPLPGLEQIFDRLHHPVEEVRLAAASEIASHASGRAASHAASHASGSAASAGSVVAVSACLLGLRCRYDGGETSAALADAGRARLAGACLLPLCPEVLAGLDTPRPAIWYAEGDGESLLRGQGRVESAAGEDMSASLLAGVERGARICAAAQVGRAVLKEGSPSCAVRRVHGADGPRPGKGAMTARLLLAGIAVENELGEQPPP
jgi:uncharacterized protein YbbK (DUF523 family)